MTSTRGGLKCTWVKLRVSELYSQSRTFCPKAFKCRIHWADVVDHILVFQLQKEKQAHCWEYLQKRHWETESTFDESCSSVAFRPAKLPFCFYFNRLGDLVHLVAMASGVSYSLQKQSITFFCNSWWIRSSRIYLHMQHHLPPGVFLKKAFSHRPWRSVWIRSTDTDGELLLVYRDSLPKWD